MKKIFKLFIVGLFLLNVNVYAKSSTIYVDLDEFKLSTDGKSYTDITEYDTLDEFLVDYEAGSLDKVYITNFLFDGVSTVKSPDLDDFIEDGTNETKVKTLEIRVININTTGDIELSGSTTGTMIAVNTNGVKGNINIILNGVNIDTDSKKAPAVYVYNKETTYTDCIVTIKTKANTKNYLEGGKLKKVSLIGSDELDEYTSNYSGDALTNYEKYTNYYGIYTASEIDDILFATVKADSEDLQDGDPLYFYKGSGAISSDIDLYFEGEGYLKVTSKNKEGIETKGNMTFSGGTGDYEIEAYDDCLNTTTASSAGDNVRNDLVIDVNSLIAIVNDDGDEGDAIDSNGTLTINGGNIYAFAHSTSGDAGLDSGSGTYINGGTIIATGNMTDAISSESKQDYIYVTFGKSIEADTLIVIKDQDDNVITAFKTSKSIQNLLYSSDDLDYESFKIYTGGEITGDEENGLYSKVESYTNGTEVTYTIVNSENGMAGMNNKSNVDPILIALIVEVSLLAVVVLVAYILDKKSKKKA